MTGIVLGAKTTRGKFMQEVNIVTQIFLPLSLAFIMFSLGLELTTADFKRIAIQPKDFIIGTISQILLLPMVAFGLLSVWPVEPAGCRTGGCLCPGQTGFDLR